MRFEGQHCLVTGGASGIGRAVGELFAREGAAVTVWDRDRVLGKKTLEVLRTIADRDHRFQEVDLTDATAVHAAAETLLTDAAPVGVLVNCAAIAAPEGITGPFIDMPEERWRPLVEVNFVAHVRVLQALLPSMVDRDGGAAVVNVISDSYRGQDRNLAMYGAAKAALAALTKTIARELGPRGIRVNGVSPSATATPSTEQWLSKYQDRVAKLYPLGRLGEPRDQANAIAFMASPEASWVTGQILSVNGGFL